MGRDFVTNFFYDMQLLLLIDMLWINTLLFVRRANNACLDYIMHKTNKRTQTNKSCLPLLRKCLTTYTSGVTSPGLRLGPSYRRIL